MAKESQFADTIVSASMHIDGELKSQGNIKIDGLVTGKVHTSQDLVIGPNAQIDADLIARNADIAGTVKGNVNVKGALSIQATGKILGNISCGSLDISQGAYFSGTCKMAEPKPAVTEIKE
jgi:cytoskeletal protein CcmA (bactofilin family)